MTCKIQCFYILLGFFKITIALFIAISIYCSLMKHRVEKKHLLPFDVINNELGEVLH